MRFVSFSHPGRDKIKKDSNGFPDMPMKASDCFAVRRFIAAAAREHAPSRVLALAFRRLPHCVIANVHQRGAHAWLTAALLVLCNLCFLCFLFFLADAQIAMLPDSRFLTCPGSGCHVVHFQRSLHSRVHT